MTLSNRSSWREVKASQEFPPLGETVDVDVAIIGGGMTGIMAAYLLRDSGKSVVLLERGRIGDWASGSTTGFLMEVLDTGPSDLISAYGIDMARMITESHRKAISKIEQIAKTENIECEFKRCPAYLYGEDKKETEHLKGQLADFKKLDIDTRYSSNTISIKNHGYLQLENQAKFHPLKYLFGLAKICAEGGIQIYEESEVISAQSSKKTILTLKNGKEVHAKHVFVATHNPFQRPQPLKLRFKKAWYTTYVIEAFLPTNTLPYALYEDSGIPYHYARVDKTPKGDRLIMGGEDHRSDVAVDEQKSFAALETYLERTLPSTNYTITREWKGRIIESGDGLAYIGPLSDNLFYATAYSGTGLTYAVIAAEMFHNSVMGNPNPLLRVYAANRPFSLHRHIPKTFEYIKEFFMGAVKNTIAPRA